MTTIIWKKKDGHCPKVKAYCNDSLIASIIELILREDWEHITIYPDGKGE